MSTKSKTFFVFSRKGFITLSLAMMVGCSAVQRTSFATLDLNWLFGLRLSRAEGGTVDFSKFRGKVLMIDFFTTWLNPSFVSIPTYGSLYQKYKEDGLAVVGVSLDDQAKKVVPPFVRALEIPYPVALGDENIRDGRSPFGNLNPLPILMLFDRNGNVQKIFLGAVSPKLVEESIRSLLK
jgi:thiol-disulfide isomerase/thioredoxin